MVGNSTKREKANRILDQLDRDEISYDHVKEAWIDLYGVGYLPHNNFLSAMIRQHKDWIPNGGRGKITYMKRTKFASDTE